MLIWFVLARQHDYQVQEAQLHTLHSARSCRLKGAGSWLQPRGLATSCLQIPRPKEQRGSGLGYRYTGEHASACTAYMPHELAIHSHVSIIFASLTGRGAAQGAL